MLTVLLYSLSVGLPRHRLSGCSCNSPLAHFYIQHGASSIRELHPFTTVSHLASQDEETSEQETALGIQFLFRKSRRGDPAAVQAPEALETKSEQAHPLTRMFSPKEWPCFGKRRVTKCQWTDKLAHLAEKPGGRPGTSGEGLQKANTSIRLEGPYFTPADPAKYEVVVCFVAGTGISGALAIASAFAAREDDEDLNLDESRIGSNDAHDLIAERAGKQRRTGWRRLIICWSVRAEEYIDLPFASLSKRPGLEFRPFLTGEGRPRIDIPAVLQTVKGEKPDKMECTSPDGEKESSVWSYISGPNAFIVDAELACKAAGVDYYGARWDI